DLRIAAHLTRACVDKQGFVGLHQGLALLHRLLANYWPSVHPQLDPDDGNDPTMRVSALSALIAPDLLTALRAAPLFSTQVAGPISLRYFAIAAGEQPQPTDGPKIDSNLLEAGFREVPLPVLQNVAGALQGARDELKGLGDAFQKGSGGVPGPDFSSLDRVVYQAQSAVKPRLAARASEGGVAAGPAAGATGGAAAGANGNGNGTGNAGNGSSEHGAALAAAPAPAQGITGVVRNRDDVVMLLDKIIGYYERNEPSSPLPLLLQRCRKLAALSFLDIVKDMAPGALQQVELIGGIVKEPPAKK
ncbi:MAG TPA: type VI secretion system ImpA family N-terminal domain-containing protein, partial [Polyangiaceae bacterium]|nr:type VI secretion system ImpA family N-terminal domain-containing protein [Polyangiaceae bacterium]